MDTPAKATPTTAPAASTVKSAAAPAAPAAAPAASPAPVTATVKATGEAEKTPPSDTQAATSAGLGKSVAADDLKEGATPVSVKPGDDKTPSVAIFDEHADKKAKAAEPTYVQPATTVKMLFPKPVTLTVNYAKAIEFAKGIQNVPSEYADHPYLKANGVSLVVDSKI